MARGMPSLAALLGLIAVAGYQNRDKIGDFVKGLGNSDPANPGGGMLDSVKKSLGDSPLATSISGGLGELVERFRTNGQGAKADSWVADGPNTAIDDTQVEKALGSDLIDDLVKQTGLSREQLLSRLAQVLPDVVDKMTPAGQLPA
ncbi:MAG: YidB family protein [Nitrospirales bacterium]